MGKYIINLFLLVMILNVIECSSVTSSALFSEIKKRQLDEGLTICMIYGSNIFNVMFGEKVVIKKIHTKMYFYGAQFIQDGNTFIGGTDQGLVAMNFEGNILWKIDKIVAAHSIELTPDCKKIAFRGLDKSSGYDGIQYLVVDSGRIYPVSQQGEDPSWGIGGDKLIYAENGYIVCNVIKDKSFINLAKGIYPSCSPNGSWIAFKAEDSNYYLLDTTNQSLKFILKGIEIRTPLRWSPDSKYIYFFRDSEEIDLDCLEQKEIVVYRLRDGESTPVGRVCKSNPLDFVWTKNKKIVHDP